MSRITGFALALGAACALGACAGEGGQLPTSEAPAFQTGGVGPACNLTDLRKATTALFGNKHPANETAKLFTSKNQNTTTVTPFAYTLFQYIEAKRANAWVSGDPGKGAELTLQIIACSPLDYTDNALEGTTNLAAARSAFERALDLPGTGTYAVRGGAEDETPILSGNLQAGLSAPGDFATWFGGVGKRSLLIGYSITPLEFSTEDEAGVYYDWSLVRPAGSAALEGLATISYCVSNAFDGFENELRVQHLPSGQGGTILPIPVGDGVSGVFCDPTLSLQSAAPMSFASRVLEGIFGMIRPAPLFAGAVLKGPVSGTLGDFSPTGVVDPNATIISFAVLPTGGTTNTDLPLQVLVTGAQGTPWAGITVSITASENNGATLAPCGTLAVTNDDGLAIFEHFQINKPGTVHLTATTIETPEGIAQDYDEVSVLSDDFVITGAGNEGCSQP